MVRGWAMSRIWLAVVLVALVALTGRVSARVLPAGTDDAGPVVERVLTPVARMASTLEGVTLAELRGVWTGAGRSAAFSRIYVTGETAGLVAGLLGPAGPAVKTVAGEKLDAAVWGDKAGIGIVPFEALTVRLRAVRVDGATPVDNRFDGARWPLTARVPAEPGAPATNRDPGKLTVLVMTGVTAMARHSAVAIDRSGDMGFLARRVGPELAAADITTISNEIPFVAGCVANPSANNLVFCSKPEYWENLALSGVDAVGLSGNHLLDFGRKGALESLAFYEAKGIPVYGGGANARAARAPLVLEHNGNRLGFLAANQHGPAVAWAGADKPGSARFDLPTMQAAIRALKPQVDVVFAEMQHLETTYQGEYVNVPNDRAEIDFRGLAAAGADVVTGVMAHAPQAVEARGGKLILYGLGNLFFDQTWSWPTRTGLVARHTIYDGRLINTELLVTVIEKNMQVRWATAGERAQVLKGVFAVSRW